VVRAVLGKGCTIGGGVLQASTMQTIQRELRSVLTGRRFFLLFVFLLATLILFPYAEASHFGSYAFRIIGSFAIVVSVYAANVHRSLLIFAMVLAIPALFERIVLPKVNAHSFFIFNTVLTLVFDVVIVVVIFRHVLATAQPTSETIFGALCLYLLVGFTFASVYGLVTAFQPKAFYLDPQRNLHAVPDRFDLIYYSFATMTSLGAAGITPVSAQARSFTILEAILGVLYLAVLIAGLIGAYRPKSRV
jgi:Ion channel